MDYIILLLSLGIILLGAEIFTNGVEWFGKKLNLSEGTVGSILAAVGTALPETMIPVIAIVFGTKGEGHDIGIGAILGAPFMLSTLAFFLVAVTVLVTRKRRKNFPNLNVNLKVMRRDQEFFLIVYSVAVLSAFFSHHIIKLVVALGLVLAYVVYVFQTISDDCSCDNQEHEMAPCHFARKSDDPHMGIVILQVLVALFLIVLGADIFVEKVQIISKILGIPAFVMSLVIAPIATELPEKFNSIIWVSKGKDTLALGNITGAMVFQSSVIPAIGILLTEWQLNTGAMISALLALTSAAIVYLQLRLRKGLSAIPLLAGGAFYLVFLALVFTGII